MRRAIAIATIALSLTGCALPAVYQAGLIAAGAGAGAGSAILLLGSNARTDAACLDHDIRERKAGRDPLLTPCVPGQPAK